MTTYQRILASVILGSFLIDVIHGSLIAFNLIKPPIAQAILFIVMGAFTVVGLIALALLLLSFVKKN